MHRVRPSRFPQQPSLSRSARLPPPSRQRAVSKAFSSFLPRSFKFRPPDHRREGRKLASAMGFCKHYLRSCRRFARAAVFRMTLSGVRGWSVGLEHEGRLDRSTDLMLTLLNGHRPAERRPSPRHTCGHLSVNAWLAEPNEVPELRTDAFGIRLRLTARIGGRLPGRFQPHRVVGRDQPIRPVDPSRQALVVSVINCPVISGSLRRVEIREIARWPSE
jgi:hypothetical protein